MLIKNQIYETTIIDYTAEGQGVAKIEGVPWSSTPQEASCSSDCYEDSAFS